MTPPWVVVVIPPPREVMPLLASFMALAMPAAAALEGNMGPATDGGALLGVSRGFEGTVRPRLASTVARAVLAAFCEAFRVAGVAVATWAASANWLNWALASASICARSSGVAPRLSLEMRAFTKLRHVGFSTAPVGGVPGIGGADDVAGTGKRFFIGLTAEAASGALVGLVSGFMA
jgi:hypothetical protein